MARQAEKTAPFTPAELDERAMRRRAIEALVWGMPAVNYDLMFQAALGIGGAFNQIIYWSRLPSWKNQTLTPNPDSIYLMPFIDTKDVGPVVLEIPPADEGSITGSIDDCWQTALEDVGPAGADKGEGGKYLILPPGYKGDIPPGYITLPSDTYKSYALLRSILKDGSDAAIARAVSYGKRVKLYPLADAKARPDAVFVDAIEELFDATIPYDVRFYRALDRIVQAEPWLTRDKAMIDQLRSIGIEKGKRFEPDVRAQQLLEESANEGHSWIDLRYEALFASPYYGGTHWALPADSEVVESLETDFAQPDSYPIDGRGTSYSMAFFSAKRLGAGQFYLMAIQDGEGRAFEGARTYRLTVPPKAPITQYWSATAYDRATHALIRDTPWSSRSSQSPGLKQNPDGSVNLYFAPEAPGREEANWIPTNGNGRFEVLFRLYGPEKPFFDKTWKLPDIEAVS